MLLAWTYKFLERDNVALRAVRRAAGVLPYPHCARRAAAALPGSHRAGGSFLSVAAAVLENDVEYADLGLRVRVIPDASHTTPAAVAAATTRPRRPIGRLHAKTQRAASASLTKSGSRPALIRHGPPCPTMHRPVARFFVTA